MKITATTLILIGMSLTASSAQALTVIGEDNRIEMNSRDYPWSAVGRLTSPKGLCTASLVGPSLILTAAHCIIDESTQNLVDLSQTMFSPNFIDGSSTHTARAKRTWLGTMDHTKNREDDWAILEIDQPLGNQFGYLGWSPLNMTAWNPDSLKIMLPGYSADFRGAQTAGVDPDCRIVKQDSVKNYMLHNCDMNGGSSGGPMLWDGGKEYGWRVVGVSVAHRVDPVTRRAPHGAPYTDEFANIAVNPAKFDQKLAELRNSP